MTTVRTSFSSINPIMPTEGGIAYKTTQTYNINDTVIYNGIMYACTQNNTTNITPSYPSANWLQLSRFITDNHAVVSSNGNDTENGNGLLPYFTITAALSALGTDGTLSVLSNTIEDVIIGSANTGLFLQGSNNSNSFLAGTMSITASNISIVDYAIVALNSPTDIPCTISLPASHYFNNVTFTPTGSVNALEITGGTFTGSFCRFDNCIFDNDISIVGTSATQSIIFITNSISSSNITVNCPGLDVYVINCPNMTVTNTAGNVYRNPFPYTGVSEVATGGNDSSSNHFEPFASITGALNAATTVPIVNVLNSTTENVLINGDGYILKGRGPYGIRSLVGGITVSGTDFGIYDFYLFAPNGTTGVTFDVFADVNFQNCQFNANNNSATNIFTGNCECSGQNIINNCSFIGNIDLTLTYSEIVGVPFITFSDCQGSPTVSLTTTTPGITCYFNNCPGFTLDITGPFVVYRDNVLSIDLIANTNISTTGVQSIDSVNTGDNNFVWLNNQTTPAERGLWWTSSTGAWTQLLTITTIMPEAILKVKSGTTYNNILLHCGVDGSSNFQVYYSTVTQF